MNKAKIQAAVGQYSLGFSTCLGPSNFGGHQSLGKGIRHADGWLSEFYEEGFEDAARGTRIALNDKEPMFVGRKANIVQSDPESQQERKLLRKIRDCLARNPSAPSEQVIAIVGAECESIILSFEEEHELDRARERMAAAQRADEQAREEARLAAQREEEEAERIAKHQAFLKWEAEQEAARLANQQNKISEPQQS